jgi:putative FmdB family regulatory protein
MPFYEYRCGQCGHQLEALQRLADAPLRDCPECGAGALERLISAPAFRLKGGGWYETDFKSGAKRNLAESGDAKPDTKSAESKSTASKPSSASTKASDPA